MVTVGHVGIRVHALAAVGHQDDGVATKSCRCTSWQALQFSLVGRIGVEYIVEVMLSRVFQYGGIVCHHRRTIGDRVSTTIDGIAYLDVDVVPTDGRRSLLIHLGEVGRLVGIRDRDVLARNAVILGSDVFVDCPRYVLSGDEVDRLLDGRLCYLDPLVDVLVVLIDTFQQVFA